MSSCPAPDLSSIGYLFGSRFTGIEFDRGDVCPAVAVNQKQPNVTLSYLRRVWMQVKLSHIIHAVGFVSRLVLAMLGFIFAPILWVFKALFSMLLFIISKILSILISPIFILWRIAVWFWGLLVGIYEENESVITYFSSALLIGAVAGIITGVLTIYFVDLLRSWSPFLRGPTPSEPRHRRRHRKSRHHQEPSHRTTTEGRITRSPRTHGSSSSSVRDRHRDSAVVHSSSSSSDNNADDYPKPPSSSRPGTRYATATGASRGGSSGLTAPSTSASLQTKGSLRRTPPAGVRVADTIHEESSD